MCKYKSARYTLFLHITCHNTGPTQDPFALDDNDVIFSVIMCEQLDW